MTKAEQETIIRWDQEERMAHLWTAYEVDARRWRRAGFDVQVYAWDRNGQPRSWSARVPMEAIRWRRLRDGQIIRRRGHGKGQVFGSGHDQLVMSEQ